MVIENPIKNLIEGLCNVKVVWYDIQNEHQTYVAVHPTGAKLQADFNNQSKLVVSVDTNNNSKEFDLMDPASIGQIKQYLLENLRK